jgi:hypothetical protein
MTGEQRAVKAQTNIQALKVQHICHCQDVLFAHGRPPSSAKQPLYQKAHAEHKPSRLTGMHQQGTGTHCGVTAGFIIERLEERVQNRAVRHSTINANMTPTIK